ncbi:MAG: hypothetical protein Kow0092_36140 [Deferrisomatales bacterium]
MALRDDLKTLARLPRSTAPFLTAYLNARWDDEKQRERVRIFVKTQLKECLAEGAAGAPADASGVKEDAEKIENYVRGLVNREWDEDYAGVALFACSELDVFHIVRSHLPFVDRFVCSDRPILRPMAEQAHAGEPAVLAMVAGDAGRLVEFELGGVRREFSFADEEFPGRHEQGGWSQGRYQRHVDDHLHRNLKRLAQHLVKWVDERRVARVVLSGPDPLLAAFDEHLPKRLRGAVCARIHIDYNATSDAIQAAALGALTEARQREDHEAVNVLLDKGLGTSRAVADPEEVAQAVAAGKVHVLYQDVGFSMAGWKCFQCKALGVRVPLGCPVCGAPVEGVDLGEEFVRDTLAADGRFVSVQGHAELQRRGGVAAALRYS